MDEMNVKAVETTENKESRPKIIAVDFDGCLATNKFPEVGEPINKTISRLKQEQANGAKVILWTNRRDKPLDDAVNFCKEQGIHLDAVNENLPEIIKAFGGDTRKIFANEYWDDRAVYMAEEEDSWAAREVALACQSEREASKGTDDWAYGVLCYESALRAYQTLARDGHSGFSIQITKSILNRLVDGKCLPPIEDTPDIWSDITGEGSSTMSKDILSVIQTNMSTFSKGQKLIAGFILESYDKAAFMTASRLGKTVNVSESTVVRFAAELGYDGYPAMQKALQEMIRSRLTSTQRIQAADNLFGGQDVLSAVIQSDMDKLRMVAEEADRTEFNKVVDLILGAGHLYILGVRTSSFVAGYLNFYLHLLSENVTLVQSNAAGEIFEQLLRIGPGDVMIAISFPRYSKVTMNTVKFAQDRGATIVAITDNELSPVYQMAEAALLAPSEMISFVDSMVAPLSLINALLIAVGSRMRSDVSRTFAELEDIWNAYGVFGKMDDE